MRLTGSGFFRFTAAVIALSILMVASVPARSMAYIVGSGAYSGAGSEASDRGEDMDKVQRALDTRVVSERLEELGLSAEEIGSRLSRLSDEELGSFASRVESIEPGRGGGFGVIIGALLLVFLVIAILKITNKTIIVK